MTASACHATLRTKHKLGRDAVNTMPRAVLIGLALITSFAVHSIASDTIRVGLTHYNGSTRSITVTATSPLSITKTGGPATLTPPANTISLEAGISEIALQNDQAITPIGNSINITPIDPTAILTIESKDRPVRKYHGALEVNFKDGTLRLVNVVQVDDYLLGVLPAEMPNGYPTEALKAQAITARTYALRNSSKHASQGFGVCDSDHCQTYLGVLAEKPKCTQAVLDTKGVVLTYDGQLASVMYSSDCGGVTDNYNDTHPDSKSPYLCGVIEPDGIPHVSWEQRYSLKELETKLVGAGVKEAEGLKSISVAKAASSGRALNVEIDGASGSTAITGGKLRDILSLKSTLFTIESQTDGTVIFKGKGSGHGVGLCQTGAKSLANAPFSFTCEQILTHYFPGAQLNGSPTPVAARADVAMVSKEAKSPIIPPARREENKNKPIKQRPIFDVRLKAPEGL